MIFECVANTREVKPTSSRTPDNWQMHLQSKRRKQTLRHTLGEEFSQGTPYTDTRQRHLSPPEAATRSRNTVWEVLVSAHQRVLLHQLLRALDMPPYEAIAAEAFPASLLHTPSVGQGRLTTSPSPLSPSVMFCVVDQLSELSVQLKTASNKKKTRLCRV